MPLLAMACVQGHSQDIYTPHIEETPHRDCDTCGECLVRQPAYGRGLTYFSEKTPRRIRNIDGGKVPIRSPRQHEDAMAQHGLTPATDWAVSMKPSRM
jgi:hypothetical protein